VRIRPTATCPACESDWPARARWCGRCGAALRLPALSDTDRRWVGRRPGRPWVVRGAAVTVLVGAAVAAVVLGPGAGLDAPTSPLDVEVALPSASSVPSAATASTPDDASADADDPADAASARPSPRRNRADLVLTRHPTWLPRSIGCLPTGCEAWRRKLNRERPPTVAGGDGLVVIVDADSATALDPATGAPRWRAPLDDLLPATAGGTRLSDLVGRERPQVAIDGDLVLVGTVRRLAALDAVDGERRWIARSTGWRLDGLTGLDTVVVLRGQPVRTDELDEAGRPRRELPITVLDREDGSVRWTTSVTELVDVDAEGITEVVDGQLRGRDPASGFVRWRRSWMPGAYAFRAGPWLVAEGARGHRLLDPGSGQELVDLDGYLAHGVLEVEDAAVSVLLDPQQGGAATTSHSADLVALAADGTTLWRERYGFAAPLRCCATLLPWDGGVAVLGLRGERELRDLATGARREWTRPLPLDGPAEVATDGTLVGEPVGDGTGVSALTVVGPDGAVIHVDGQELVVVGTGPLVVGGVGELVGVRPARGE
jgi:outer membrane protein assembly factor BamB